MRRWFFVVLAIGSCTSSPTNAPRHGPVRIELVDIDVSAPHASDAAPRVRVIIHGAAGRVSTRKAVAAVRFDEGVAYVDLARRLLVVDDAGRERELASEIAGRPIVDARGRRLAWTEPHDLVTPVLRTMAADDDAPVTIAIAPGPMVPVAFDEQGDLELLGSVNGGIAGRWTVRPAQDATLRCLTSCELRVGPPPQSGVEPIGSR